MSWVRKIAIRSSAGSIQKMVLAAPPQAYSPTEPMTPDRTVPATHDQPLEIVLPVREQLELVRRVRLPHRDLETCRKEVAVMSSEKDVGACLVGRFFRRASESSSLRSRALRPRWASFPAASTRPVQSPAGQPRGRPGTRGRGWGASLCRLKVRPRNANPTRSGSWHGSRRRMLCRCHRTLRYLR